jgi:hypothetical protein
MSEVPRITLSTLARAMGPISPAALARLLRGHKLRSEGPRRSYQLACRQAVELFTDGTPLNSDAPLRTHERDAVRAMQRMRLRIPAWLRAVRPTTRLPPLEIGGVSISIRPDVELEGLRESGAAKFAFTKAPLPRGVGSTMAALLWHHRRNVLGIASTRPGRCMVYEPRLPWLHLPGRTPEVQMRSAELACDVIRALWPKL